MKDLKDNCDYFKGVFGAISLRRRGRLMGEKFSLFRNPNLENLFLRNIFPQNYDS